MFGTRDQATGRRTITELHLCDFTQVVARWMVIETPTLIGERDKPHSQSPAVPLQQTFITAPVLLSAESRLLNSPFVL